MLGKLLKYELHSCVKTFAPLYIALAALTVFFIIAANMFISTLSDIEQYPSFVFLFVFLFYGLIIALAVVTLIVIVNRFRRTLLGKEGYLMLTLPVSIHTHIGTKIISGAIWSLANTAMILTSLFFIALSQPELKETLREIYSMDALMQVTKEFSTIFGISVSCFFIAYAVLTLLYSLYSLLLIYFSLAIGYMANRSKFLRSFVVYIMINSVLGFLLQVGVISIFLRLETLSEATFRMYFMPAIYIVGAILAALCAFFYFGTWYVIKNKLNLE